jgi:hypothetical protein
MAPQAVTSDRPNPSSVLPSPFVLPTDVSRLPPLLRVPIRGLRWLGDWPLLGDEFTAANVSDGWELPFAASRPERQVSGNEFAAVYDSYGSGTAVRRHHADDSITSRSCPSSATGSGGSGRRPGTLVLTPHRLARRAPAGSAPLLTDPRRQATSRRRPRTCRGAVA